MNFGRLSERFGLVAMVAGLGAAGACVADEEPDQNVLPTSSGADSDGGSGTGSASASASASSQSGTVGPDSTADTTEGGGGVTFPATYRFDCIDILELGDSDGDGAPDGGAIQAMLLENTWASDIDSFKLNVMLTVRGRDEEGGTANVVVGSGIGASASDLCTEPTTAGAEQMALFELGVGAWQPSAAAGSCSEPAAEGDYGGTYDFSLDSTETVYVYAEDDDGTVFNCVPGGAAPNAVPLRAVRATVTVDPTEQIAAGQLTGCLVDAEAQNLCSCLGECSGSPHADCGGCPDGSVPLAELLGGVGPTDNCTAIMGTTAYDLTVGFSTTLISEAEPMVCGG